MSTKLELTEGEFAVTPTNIQIDPTGKLISLKIVVYGYDPKDNTQFIETSFCINQYHHITETEAFPAMFAAVAVKLFRNISAFIEAEFDELLIDTVKHSTQHLSHLYKKDL